MNDFTGRGRAFELARALCADGVATSLVARTPGHRSGKRGICVRSARKKNPSQAGSPATGLYFFNLVVAGTRLTDVRLISSPCTRTVSTIHDLLDDVIILKIESFRKEVIQPQVPLRLPCYDLVPIAEFIFGACSLRLARRLRIPPTSWLDGRCVQGSGTHSPQYADLRLLAIPASCRRVAACNPNWGTFFGICWLSRVCFPLCVPL